MGKDLSSKIKSSLIWNTSVRIVYQVFRFAISIVIARLLEPRDFGIMGIATMIVFYTNNVTNFGFNLALIQKKEINEVHVNSVFTFNLVISLLFTVGTIMLSADIADFFKTPELKNVFRALSPLFVITSFFQIPATLMQRQVNFKVTALTELYRGITQSFVTLALAFMGFHYWSLVIGLITSYIISTLYIISKVEWKPRITYVHNEIKDIFVFGMYNFIRSQISLLSEYADKFIIGKFMGPALLGSYDKAFTTAAVVKQEFSQKVNAVMFSSFSRLKSETNSEIKYYFKRSLSLISLSTFPFCMGLASLGTYFVRVLLGSKWEPMIIPLKILAIAFLFSSIGGLATSLNVSMDNYKKQTIYDLGGIVLLVFITLLVVQQGIEFVAMGILFNYALMSFLTFRLAKKEANIHWMALFNSILPAVIGSIIMVLIIFIAKKFFFNVVNLINLITLTGIGASAYFLAVFLPRYTILEDYRKQLIMQIKKLPGLSRC